MSVSLASPRTLVSPRSLPPGLFPFGHGAPVATLVPGGHGLVVPAYLDFDPRLPLELVERHPAARAVMLDAAQEMGVSLERLLEMVSPLYLAPELSADDRLARFLRNRSAWLAFVAALYTQFQSEFAIPVRPTDCSMNDRRWRDCAPPRIAQRASRPRETC
jgi:hypothetical protein